MSTLGSLAGVLALAVVAFALLGLTVATARRPATPVPDLDGYFDRWSPLHGGVDPRGSGLVRWWLGIAYRASQPLAARGVLPDVLTLWGLEVGYGVVVLAAARGRWPLLGVVVVVASGLLDNLDGCVAVLTERSTALGYVVDSVVDRITDVLYLVALWALGAPAGLCVAAGVALGLLEYGRARAGNAGMGEVGVVTVGERPTRVVLMAFSLLAAGLFPGHQPLMAGIGAGGTLGLCLVSCGQLGVAVRRALAPR